VPPEIEQATGAPIGPPNNEQPVSLAEKPEPATTTVDPAGAEAGLSVMDGPEFGT